MKQKELQRAPCEPETDTVHRPKLILRYVRTGVYRNPLKHAADAHTSALAEKYVGNFINFKINIYLEVLIIYSYNGVNTRRFLRIPSFLFVSWVQVPWILFDFRYRLKNRALFQSQTCSISNFWQLSPCHKLCFFNPYFYATCCRRP